MPAKLPNDIEDLRKRLSALESDVKLTLNTVTELKLGLCGSDKIGLDGMVQKVNRHERYIENDKKAKYKFAGAVSLLTFLISMGISIIAIYYSNKKTEENVLPRQQKYKQHGWCKSIHTNDNNSCHCHFTS